MAKNTNAGTNVDTTEAVQTVDAAAPMPEAVDTVTKVKRPIPSLVHRINTQMKTQVLKGSMTMDELDAVITHATKLREIAGILSPK